MLRLKVNLVIFFILICFGDLTFAGMPYKQFQSTLAMMRSVCGPKFKITEADMDNLKHGAFPDDPELKCYVKCIAEMAGTLGKKGEISAAKTLKQIDTLVPNDMQKDARLSFDACINVQKDYKDSCDKVFYTSKCTYEFNPAIFLFP